MNFNEYTHPMRRRVAQMATRNRVLTIIVCWMSGTAFLAQVPPLSLATLRPALTLIVFAAVSFVAVQAFVTDWVHGSMDWDR